MNEAHLTFTPSHESRNVAEVPVAGHRPYWMLLILISANLLINWPLCKLSWTAGPGTAQEQAAKSKRV